MICTRHASRLLILIGAATAASSVPVSAQLTFFGEDLNHSESVRIASHPNADAARFNFFSRLVGTGTETFEGFASNSSVPLNLGFPGSLGTTITAVLSQSGFILNQPTGTNGIGIYPISGNKVLQADGANFQVDFNTPVAAFGFYGVDIGDFGGQLSLVFSNSGANARTYVVPHTLGSSGSTGGSVLYFGLIDNTNLFNRVRFLNSSSGESFGFDNMTVGDLRQVVPEPGTVALLTTLMVSGLGLIKRRKNAPVRKTGTGI